MSESTCAHWLANKFYIPSFSGNFHEVLEYLAGGTLNYYLCENARKLVDSSELLLGIAVSIADGMDFLGQHKVSLETCLIFLYFVAGTSVGL